MLHVIGLILKIIGLLILCLLGLALLMLLCALFVPVRYSGKGEKQGMDMWVMGKVTWLLHILSAKVYYKYKQEPELVIRLFGINITRFIIGQEDAAAPAPQRKKAHTTHSKNEKAAAEGINEGMQKKDIDIQDTDVDTQKKAIDTEEKTMDAQATAIGAEDKAIGTEDKTVDMQDKAIDPQDKDIGTTGNGASSQDIDIKTKEKTADTEDIRPSFFQRIHAFFKNLIRSIRKFFKKCASFFQNIKYTCEKFCDRIVDIEENVSYYMNLLQDEENKKTIAFVLGQIKHIFKHILPTKCQITLEIGTGDPASTGNILAYYGMFYPLLGNVIQINPDFEKQILDGHFFLKGRIRLFTLLWDVARVYFDKNFRKLIKLLKKEEEQNGSK